MAQAVETLIEGMIYEAERDLRRAGQNYQACVEDVQSISASLADAADYGYAYRVSDLTEMAQKVARYHQESKTLQDHIAALKYTLEAAKEVK